MTGVSTGNGGRFLPPGYACVLRTDWLRPYSITVLPNGTYLGRKDDDGL